VKAAARLAGASAVEQCRAALAALQRGELDAAAQAAARAADLGGERYLPWRDFLFGNVAFARCEQAARLAELPEGGLPALEEALARARAARDHWQRAAASRADWPRARRNVERALLTIEELERRKTALLRRKPSPPALPPPLRPPPSPDRDPGKEPPTAVAPPPQLAELDPDQIERLFERLDEKERQRVAVRRERRRATSASVEQDW
jgi:hypothetical protein